jgi:DNA-binding PadR family transcriptional regulator
VVLIEELKRHGYDLGPGTLYPMLHAMEAEGLVSMEERVVAGKRRKYYTATEAGHRALTEAREKIGELVDEVLDGRGPARLLEPPEKE